MTNYLNILQIIFIYTKRTDKLQENFTIINAHIKPRVHVYQVPI